MKHLILFTLALIISVAGGVWAGFRAGGRVGYTNVMDRRNGCEQTVADGDVAAGGKEVFQFHVNTSSQRVCHDISDAFQLGQDLDCDSIHNTGDNSTIYTDMKREHYVCVTFETGHQQCLDLYEMTER